MLFATSCQNDLDVMGNVGEEALVSFNVTTPDMATRAYSDGTTATVLQYAVYDAAGNELTKLTETEGEIHTSTTVKLQLTTGNTYSVIFWAAAEDAPYTVNFGSKTMTVDYDGAKSNDENRDAFYKYHTFTVRGAQTETVELKRPFAQLNIGTNDYASSTTAGYTPTQSAVTVKQVYSTLNLATGAVDGPANVTYNYEAIPTSETFPVDGYDYLAMNYLLVASDKALVDIEFGYTETDAAAAKTRTVGSVPVQRNYRTNIYGALLTSDVDINVEIKPEYDEPSLEAEELFMAAAFGGEVTLTEDVVLNAPLEVQANMVLDLNGKTITTTEESAGRHYYAINNNATLVIKGEGAINARGIKNFGTMVVDGNVTITNIDTNGGAAIWNEGKLTINNGTFTTNNTAGEGSYGAALNTRAGGEAVVNGGTFVAYSQLTYAIICEGKTVINDANVAGKHGAVAGTSTTTTEIYGGSFELLDNPGVSDHCTYFVTAIYGGVFTLGNNNDNGGQVFYESTIATGYHAVENDGKFYVVAEGIDAVVTSQANLETALASGDAKIYLAAGEYTMPATGKFNAGDVVVCAPGTIFTGSSNANINGATIEGATFSNPGGSAVSSTINGTFKGCTFEGSNGARWAYAGETVVFEDCVFSGSTYGVHFDGGANDVIFRNCTLSGFNALGGELTMVTFEDCTFVGNGKSAYNGANLWGSVAFKNCEFTFDGTSTYEWIDCIGADKTYSFDNCTINGVAYSAENYASYIANIWSRNHKTVKINGVDCTL